MIFIQNYSVSLSPNLWIMTFDLDSDLDLCLTIDLKSNTRLNEILLDKHIFGNISSAMLYNSMGLCCPDCLCINIVV